MPRSRIRDGAALLRSVFTGTPFLITRDQIGEMNRTVRKLVLRGHFDAIHADQLWMAPYALIAREEALRCGYCPQLILDQHNAVYLIPKRMADSSTNLF